MAKDVKTLLKKHLEKGRTVTGLQALRWWQTTRLAVYVQRLRKDGYVVKTNMVTKGQKTFAQYWL